jgi:hypothetical protein
MTENFTCTSQHSIFSQSCFTKKTIFFMLYVKRQNPVLKEFFLSFYTRHKNVVFSQNMAHAYRISRCACWIFVTDFLTFWKCFFGGRSICSCVPNWTSKTLDKSKTLFYGRRWYNTYSQGFCYNSPTCDVSAYFYLLATPESVCLLQRCLDTFTS